MSKKLVCTIMLGMNRYTGRDTAHPFDMSHTDDYNTFWLPQISDKEKTNSTPIYEITKTVDRFIKQSNSNSPEIDQIVKDNVLFIIGRGTVGDSSEEHLSDALLEARKSFGENAFYLFYAKSFGVVDTLKALKIVRKENRRFMGNLFFCIDGYATTISKRDVSIIYRSGGQKERRFIKPPNIKKIFSIVQRQKGFKGLNMGCLGNANSYIRNFTITSKDMNNAPSKYYTAYSDGYRRKLNISHYNMEEIVSVLPCCSLSGQTYTVNDTLGIYLKKYVAGKS